MLAIEKVVLLCRNKTPIIVSGADTSVTMRSAAHSASRSGFLTRVVDCEQSEISSVELPQTPLNTTMPYRIIKASSDKELRNSPLASSNESLSTLDVFNGNAVVVVVLMKIFREEFLIGPKFGSHCDGPSMILLRCT